MAEPGSEARFRTVADLAPDAVVFPVRGRLVYANPAAVRASSYADVPELLAIDPSNFPASGEVATMSARIECVRRVERSEVVRAFGRVVAASVPHEIDDPRGYVS
jgi:PAS domain-containing protein